MNHIVTEYDQVTDQLFIGSNACCRVDFKEDLLSVGITANISLEDDRSDAPYGVDSYLWLPTLDGHAPSAESLRLGVDHLLRLVEQGRKVLVHCKNGHGRAPTLVAAYLTTTGLSAQEAIELVVSKRTNAHLNQEQSDAVHAFARQ